MPFTATEFKTSTSDGHIHTLLEPTYYIRPSTGETIVIPAGATSDGASIPRAVWNILPPFGVYWRAAFLHDYLYRKGDRVKRECDYIFKEAMEDSGVPSFIIDVLYEGVSIGGGWSFTDDRKMQLISQLQEYYGKELDSRSNQVSGSVAQGTGSAAGQEDTSGKA